MENEFRGKVLDVADKGIKIMQQYFGGDSVNSDMIKQASRMISEGVKVSNRDQVDAQVKRSQALRIIQFIPKERVAEYISVTNPEAKPYFLPPVNTPKQIDK